jgi:hypothetical protein
VGRIDKNLVLTKEVIQEEQAKDVLYEQYRQSDDLWLDEDSVPYKKGPSGQSHIEERRQICDTPIAAKGGGELYRKQCETHMKVVLRRQWGNRSLLSAVVRAWIVFEKLSFVEFLSASLKCIIFSQK